jgi:A/G-specific adenine glycosylase
MELSFEDIQSFQDVVWQYYHDSGRSMPWRDNTDPYHILVSELMLQQTQVERVIPKFEAFIAVFPTSLSLSQASLSDVLILWSGLGYNRRAKFLHEAAKMIQTAYDGSVPGTSDELVRLPGVGPNTAGAILAYGFNIPVSFIETNIRTVLFHHFFQNGDTVNDQELKIVLDQVLDLEHPREWYWALMDYGTFLKKEGVGRNAQSTHYKKQTPLKGSIREIRGQILKQLTKSSRTEEKLRTVVTNDDRFSAALRGLISDGLVTLQNGQFHLTK